ncbi:MAG TPA: hypothetical protein VKW09_15815 [bacterium]|nr:hypothetical protein [bacterium]
MNARTRTRNRGLKWGLTAASLLTTLLGWKSFAATGPQTGPAAPAVPSAESPTPAPSPIRYVRMAVATAPDGQVYLVPLATDSAPAPAPIARTQSSR